VQDLQGKSTADLQVGVSENGGGGEPQD